QCEHEIDRHGRSIANPSRTHQPRRENPALWFCSPRLREWSTLGRPMQRVASDKVFGGSIPELYDTYFVPLIFEPYAVDLANRVRAHAPSRVLELAAGTGVVTRALASVLPAHVPIIATDLNQRMLDRAASVGTSRAVTWQQADAMQLPFRD